MSVPSQNCQKTRRCTARLYFFCDLRSLGGSSCVHTGAMLRARDQLGTLVRHIEGLVILSVLAGCSCTPIFAQYKKCPIQLPDFLAVTVCISPCVRILRLISAGSRPWCPPPYRDKRYPKSQDSFAFVLRLLNYVRQGWAPLHFCTFPLPPPRVRPPSASLVLPQYLKEPSNQGPQRAGD